MTAHQISLSISPMDEASPDSRLHASRIEFTVGTAPQQVGQAHVADQLAKFERHLRSAAATSRLPSPEPTKPSTMPTDNSLRLHDHQVIHNARRNPIEVSAIFSSAAFSTTRAHCALAHYSTSRGQ